MTIKSSNHWESSEFLVFTSSNCFLSSLASSRIFTNLGTPAPILHFAPRAHSELRNFTYMDSFVLDKPIDSYGFGALGLDSLGIHMHLEPWAQILYDVVYGVKGLGSDSK